MQPNLERYKKDLTSLIDRGDKLRVALEMECLPKETEAVLKTQLGDRSAAYLASLPDFASQYELWYSESKTLVRQLLPDRLVDFVRHYEKPRQRKSISYDNYTIEDCLLGLTVTQWNDEKVVGPDAAIPHFRQQLAIVKSVKTRFESSLLDIRQLVQADLLDSELEAGRVLATHGFTRAAGAIAGVVLEHHLGQVVQNHGVTLRKKDPSIAELNDALKSATIIDLPQWRSIQHLADIRNLCDHKKRAEPTANQVEGLLSGVETVTKTLF